MLFEALAKLDAAGDLLVLDRGYVGNTMVASLAQRGLGFCLRADTRGWRCVADFLRPGDVPEALGAGVVGSVTSLTVRPNGTLVVGGDLVQAGTTSVGCIAQWNGATWAGLGSGLAGGAAWKSRKLRFRSTFSCVVRRPQEKP